MLPVVDGHGPLETNLLPSLWQPMKSCQSEIHGQVSSARHCHGAIVVPFVSPFNPRRCTAPQGPNHISQTSQSSGRGRQVLEQLLLKGPR